MHNYLQDESCKNMLAIKLSIIKIFLSRFDN